MCTGSHCIVQWCSEENWNVVVLGLFFTAFIWKLWLQRDALLLALCRKLMGLQRQNYTDDIWMGQMPFLLGFEGLSRFRVRSICREIAQSGEIFPDLGGNRAKRSLKHIFSLKMKQWIWSQKLCHGRHLSHQDGVARRSPAGRDVHARLHMKGPQSATVSNGNGTFL